LRDRFLFFNCFRARRPFFRYRFLLFNCFQARKNLLPLPFSPFQLLSGTQDSSWLPFSPFQLLSGTQEPSSVTVFSFSTAFGHARTFFRYRFLFSICFQARKNLLALLFSLFQLLSGTQEPSSRYRLLFLKTLK
jgi:hypothetical protein